MKQEQYIINGMSCAACSSSVNRVVSRLEGVKSCDVNLITGKMTVEYDESKTGAEDFIRVVEKAGFEIYSDKIESDNVKTENFTKEESNHTTAIIISAILSAVLLYISMGQMIFENLPVPFFININSAPENFAITQLLLCIPVIFLGKKFFISGIPLLLKGHPNMDSLVAIGSGASFIYSIVMTYSISYDIHAVHNLYYETVAVVITLVMLGKYFEQKSKRKTTSAIKKLMELSPDTALVLKDGKEYTVPTADVNVGEILIVKPGSKIPLDGIISEGFGSIDESMLTGESIPVEKKTGESVIGGSININGIIYVKVTKTGSNTTLAKIIKFVEDAQSKKAPISKTADKVAGIFVPVVIVIAVLSAVIWLFAGKDLSFALKVFTGVLVIACPCALGLATPTAIMVGTGLGASNGILIRNGEILEITHNVKAAVFDKTGTVTVGKATVTDVIAENKEHILKLVASAESVSNHPLATAITSYAKTSNIVFSEKPENFLNIAGKGLKCSVDGESVIIGNQSFLEENGIDISLFKDCALTLSKQGKSLVFAAINGKAEGLIAISDQVKPSSLQAFKKLKELGVKTVILSGDNKACADYIGNYLEADEVYSEVLPEQKAEIIKNIRSKYGTVMMIGDGINDAPALTQADIGCAIGNGSDIAIEAADIVLMRNDPCDVPATIRLSRLTIANIKQNLFWAFCYNTICIPVAAGLLYAFGGPLLSPMIAGLAMSFSSVFVVANALRLRSKKL